MAGLRTSQNLFVAVGTTIQSKTLSTSSGVVLEIEAQWKGRTQHPTSGNFLETAIFASMVDSGGANVVFSEGIFVIPSNSGIHWYHPYHNPITSAAEISSRMRVNTAARAFGTFNGSLVLRVLSENFNPSSHDLMIKIVFMEFD